MDLRVQLRLLPPSEGGRTFPVHVGYRSTWDNGDRLPNGSVHYHDAPIVALAREPLPPGEETGATLRALRPEHWRHVSVGDKLAMSEGSHVLGSATVLEKIDNE